MRVTPGTVSSIEKDRIRTQISQQVADFIRAGGKISVVSSGNPGKVRGPGASWGRHEDYFPAGEAGA